MTRGLFVEVLEARVNPASFTARTDIGPVQWNNPAAWSDDPAATEIPGPGDTVTVGSGEWDVHLGDAEVTIDNLVTQGVGGTAPHLIILRHGTLRLSQPSVLANKYTEDGSADPLNAYLVDASLVAGDGPSGGMGRVVVHDALRMDGVAFPDAHLSVTGQASLFGAKFKSVTVEEGAELLTFPAARNPDGSGLKVGLTTGSLVNHGTLAGVTAFPGFLHAADVTNHGYADLSGGARLTGDLVNHNELRASGPTVHAANFTNSKDAVIGVDGRPLDPGYPAIVVAGTAKLDGVVYVEQMGVIPTQNSSEPYIADFLTFSNLEGRFRELATPEPGGELPSTGLRDPDATQFVGLDYEADRVAFSLIDYPVADPFDIFLDPTSPSGADGLVVVFNGASGGRFLSMASAVHDHIGPPERVGTWDVVTINWQPFTSVNDYLLNYRRREFAQNGYDLGASLAYWFRNQGLEYSKFHVVGYSMGSWPADGFVDALQAMGIAGLSTPGHSHLTLLDSYVPTFGLREGLIFPGRTLPTNVELGDSASYAEQYLDFRDILGPATDFVLPNAFNVNVQELDTGFRLGDLISNPFYGHGWVPAWYERTANIQNPDSVALAKGWGYLVAPEWAGASPAHSKYARGDLIYLTPTGIVVEVLPGPVRTTAVGAGARVYVVGPDGKVASDFAPFGDGFTGQVRTAAADFNGDGVADLVAGTGPGGATRVIVFDGATRAELFRIDPFEASFTGGVYVAAGDLDGDGKADLVITPDEGGGPRARVFSGNGFAQLADFFGIEDVNFRGGARPAIGDITGDGKADLVIAAGFGGGPRVGVFDGAKIAAEGRLADQGAARWNTWKPFGDFLAFEPALRNGTFVAVGDLDGDRFAELIAGGGPGGGPRVTAFGGKGLMNNTPAATVNFFAGDVNNRGGVRVSVKDLDGDDRSDLVVGAGTGGGSRVTGYTATALASAEPQPAFAFDAISGFAGGVFVG